MGKGSFGKVWRAVVKGAEVAVKVGESFVFDAALCSRSRAETCRFKLFQGASCIRDASFASEVSRHLGSKRSFCPCFHCLFSVSFSDWIQFAFLEVVQVNDSKDHAELLANARREVPLCLTSPTLESWACQAAVLELLTRSGTQHVPTYFGHTEFRLGCALSLTIMTPSSAGAAQLLMWLQP